MQLLRKNRRSRSREGGIIKDGYHEEIDRLREAKSQGKNWLAELRGKGTGKDRDQEFKDQVQ